MEPASIEIQDRLTEKPVYLKVTSPGHPLVRLNFWIPEPDGERDQLELVISCDDARAIASALTAAADEGE